MRRLLMGAAALLAAVPAHAEVPLSLRGSPASMVRQNQVAKGLSLPFIQSPAELRALASAGELVALEGNADYELADFVRYPLARPEMELFIRRLAAQYHEATGEKLVVTSLTRPASRQPGNSHALSVHPTGIAVDLRVSQRQQSRAWLESTLLSLEERGILDVTRERNPPHYHIALFPEEYLAYIEPMLQEEAREEARLAAAREAEAKEAYEAFAPSAEKPEDGEGRKRSLLLAMLLVAPAAGLAVVYRRSRNSEDADE